MSSLFKAIEAEPLTFQMSGWGSGLATIKRWFWKIASYASLNAMSRVIQMVAAFLVVRSLAKTEYAWYSLAQNLVAALGAFTVTGISTGLLPMAGEVAADRRRLGVVLASAARFRGLLLGLGAVTVLPVFAHLLLHSGCPVFATTLLVAAALVATVSSIASQMLNTPLSLAQRYNVPQIDSILQSLLRLLLIGLLIYASCANAATLLLAAVVAPLPSLWLWLMPRAKLHADFTQRAQAGVTARLKKHFFVGLPTSLTYLFEAQIAAFIIAFLGQLDQVAELGAISRVALILQVPIGIAAGMLTPRMSAEESLARLWKMWIGTCLLAVLIGAVVMVCGWFFRSTLLQLLGGDYAGLESELMFYLAFQVFAFVGTIVGTPIQSKGWVRHSWIRPVLVFGSQAAAACFLDLSTVTGAIALMWAGSIGNNALNAFLLFNGWRGRAAL